MQGHPGILLAAVACAALLVRCSVTPACGLVVPVLNRGPVRAGPPGLESGAA